MRRHAAHQQVKYLKRTLAKRRIAAKLRGAEPMPQISIDETPRQPNAPSTTLLAAA